MNEIINEVKRTDKQRNPNWHTHILSHALGI